MPKSDFTFNYAGDRIRYTYRQGVVSYYDCGHEYIFTVTEQEAQHHIESSNWINICLVGE